MIWSVWSKKFCRLCHVHRRISSRINYLAGELKGSGGDDNATSFGRVATRAHPLLRSGLEVDCWFSRSCDCRVTKLFRNALQPRRAAGVPGSDLQQRLQRRRHGELDYDFIVCHVPSPPPSSVAGRRREPLIWHFFDTSAPTGSRFSYRYIRQIPPSSRALRQQAAAPT